MPFVQKCPVATEVDLELWLSFSDSGMEIGLAVVVRELTESGNAFKEGVKIGDEIEQVRIYNYTWLAHYKGKFLGIVHQHSKPSAVAKNDLF